MDEKQIQAELAKAVKTNHRYLIGTKAYHLTGDISRKNEALFSTDMETDNYYVGSWVTGFGFVQVLFPKFTSRGLTEEEVRTYNQKYVQIGSNPPIKLKVNYD